MTPQQALQLIDQVLQNVNATRSDHLKIQEAVTILAQLVLKNDTEK